MANSCAPPDADDVAALKRLCFNYSIQKGQGSSESSPSDFFSVRASKVARPAGSSNTEYELVASKPIVAGTLIHVERAMLIQNLATIMVAPVDTNDDLPGLAVYDECRDDLARVYKSMPHPQNTLCADHPIGGFMGTFVAPMLCALQHDCRPNTQLIDTTVRFDSTTTVADTDSQHMDVYLYAALDIEEGDVLTRSFIDMYMPTPQRRSHAPRDAATGKTCQCKRCTTPDGGFLGERLMTATKHDDKAAVTPEAMAELEETLKDFSARYNNVKRSIASGNGNSKETTDAMKTFTADASEVFNRNKLLHDCHWHRYQLNARAIEFNVALAQYFEALSRITHQICAVCCVFGDYPCREKLVLFMRYKWCRRMITERMEALNVDTLVALTPEAKEKKRRSNVQREAVSKLLHENAQGIVEELDELSRVAVLF